MQYEINTNQWNAYTIQSSSGGKGRCGLFFSSNTAKEEEHGIKSPIADTLSVWLRIFCSSFPVVAVLEPVKWIQCCVLLNVETSKKILVKTNQRKLDEGQVTLRGL